MGKTILIVTLLVLTLGCSKDKDEDTRPITFSDERLGGIWYMSKVIKPNDAIEDYIHLCPTSKDRVEMSVFAFNDFYHGSNCDVNSGASSCKPSITNYTTVTGCDFKYNGIYTLSGNTLRVDYGEVRFLGFIDNNFETAKGLIFSRN